MRKILTILTVALITALALNRFQPTLQMQTVSEQISVESYFGVGIEYANPTTVVGVSTFGPAQKETLCNQAIAALVAQAPQFESKGHITIGTCLHVAFRGPLAKPAVIVQPFSGEPLEYALIAIEYAADGTYIGAQPLHAAPTARACAIQAREVISENSENLQGKALLIYCLPIPTLPSQNSSPGDTV